MATPGTCHTLDHHFQGLSISQGSSSPSRSFGSISKEDESTMQRCGVEQFLDLKTGELCYYDWSAGRKTKNDPTQVLRVLHQGKEALVDRPEIEELSSSSEEEEEDENDDDSDDSESMDEDSEDSQESPFPSPKEVSEGHGACSFGSKDPTVLVAAGCQSCLMYYMLPKYVIHCPKCGTAVLHFNEPESASTSKGKEIEETNTS